MLVDATICDAFVDKFVARAKNAFVPGDPLDPATTMGPLVTEEQLNRVLGYVEAGRKEGAKVVVGGGRAGTQAKGYYMEPTLFCGVNPGMKIAQEEIFGPVAAVLPFNSTE